MKLESVEITNFRGIEHLRLDLVDELGRIRDRFPIVGPNTSGKTSILDAISLCLMQMSVTEIIQRRAGLSISPRSIVRRGAVQARVSCTVWFSDDEIAAVKSVFHALGSPYPHVSVPDANRVVVHWEFPDRQGEHRFGYNRFEPRDAWTLFKGRILVARSLYVPGISPRLFRRLGGVFLFDQQRTGLATRIPAADQELLRRRDPEQLLASSAAGADEPEYRSGNGYTSDPRLILLNLATRAQASQDPEATERQDYERLRELYAHACRPHKIRGLYNTEYGLDMEFEGDHSVYHFDGLSSGQEMILLLLLQFATKHIHRSIVLVDELELHLHPLWQSRLYDSLAELGEENQYFFTTHSTYLRDAISDGFFHCTGELGDAAIDGQSLRHSDQRENAHS